MADLVDTDFEDPPYDTGELDNQESWDCSVTSIFSISTTQSRDSQSLFVNNDTVGYHAQLAYTAQSGDHVLDFYIYATNASGSTAYFGASDGSMSYAPNAAVIISVQGNELVNYDGGWEDITDGTGDILDGEWYHIEVEIDPTTDTYQLWLDGVKQGTTWGFGNSHSAPDHFYIRCNGNYSDDLYLDDLYIYTGSRVAGASDLSINVSDLINATEDLGRGMPLGAVSRHETMTINELRELLVSISPNVFENMTIIEFMSAVMTIKPDVFESINITEFATVIRDSHLVDKYENITIEEFNSLAMNLAMNLSEILTIIEDVSASISGDVTISESETITIIENLQAAMLLGTISASDLINITEDISAVVSELALINVNASEVINIVEDISGVMTIQVSFFDLIKISEYIVLNLPSEISVAEELRITEQPDVEVVSMLAGSDLITLTEYVLARFDWERAQIQDVITITESIVLLSGGFGWSTSQSVNITEYVLVSMVSFVLHNFTARTKRFNFNAGTRAFGHEAKKR